MSLFAGIVARGDRAVPPPAARALKQGISRDPDDRPQVFETARYCCVKVDIGAFGTAGHTVDANGAFSLMAGEPLLPGEAARDADLRAIHSRCLVGDLSVLRGVAGAFAIAQYDPATETLRLIADKLTIRPLYYWETPDFVAFATAVRVLESLPGFTKTLDVRAVTEMNAFGYPLADRMAYAGMRLLRPGEIVEATRGRLRRFRYWHWDDIPASREPEPALARELHVAFDRAVKRRLGTDRTTAAYLSGGLDSRAVVAALTANGARVQTFNFARPGTQDRALGAAIAARLGTLHHEIAKEAGDRKPDYSQLMARAWPRRQAVAWSGEGGSVALGHVHLHAAAIDRMRRGDVAGATTEYLTREGLRLPLKMFTPATARRLASVLIDGVGEELAELGKAEPGRAFHLFLLQNDQRRKLASHFEHIDLHRLEFQLPFFDSGVIAAIVQAPVDLCLGHRFYHAWLRCFDPIVTSVPWQAYPGHEACPLAVPPGLAYQWDAAHQRAEQAAQKRALLRRVMPLLIARDFPGAILSRGKLAAAAACHAAGWRSYEYALDAACLWHRYWRNCDGGLESRIAAWRE